MREEKEREKKLGWGNGGRKKWNGGHKDGTGRVVVGGGAERHGKGWCTTNYYWINDSAFKPSNNPVLQTAVNTVHAVHSDQKAVRAFRCA